LLRLGKHFGKCFEKWPMRLYMSTRLSALANQVVGAEIECLSGASSARNLNA
jgi:hypothetical protein